MLYQCIKIDRRTQCRCSLAKLFGQIKQNYEIKVRIRNIWKQKFHTKFWGPRFAEVGKGYLMDKRYKIFVFHFIFLYIYFILFFYFFFISFNSFFGSGVEGFTCTCVSVSIFKNFCVVMFM